MTETERKEVLKAIKPFEIPMFRHNPGKTGEVFPKEHPYFDIPDEYKKLAKKNFNLPIPDGNKV